MDVTIIITNNNNKKRILKELSIKKILCNLKFYSFQELKKKLYFDYDNKTLFYIMNKYQVNMDIAKTYIENLYFLQDIDNPKIKFLNNLKQELEENNLLIKTLNFKEYLNNKNLIVYQNRELTKEEKLILKDYKYTIKSLDENIFIPLVYEADEINSEVLFVLNKICELINRKVELNKIKIVAQEEYHNILKRMFNIFNIPLNINSNSNYYSTLIAQEFLNNYDNLDIKDNIDLLKEKYDVNDLITIINKSVDISNKDIRKYFIINDLKNTKLDSIKYLNAVSLTNLEEVNKDDYVFLLGFNINDYPKIKKDEDYLSDKEKDLLNLSNSLDLNRLTKEELINTLNSLTNLVITYKLHNKKGECYPSILIDELNLNVNKIDNNPYISYSLLNSKITYTNMLDNLIKYNITDEYLGLYQNSLNIPYREYNHIFKEINLNLLKKRLNNELNLAYTSIEAYYECAFKYYLSYILNINKEEESFKLKLGNITHYILEEALKRDINITEEIMNYVKDNKYELGPKEYFYLEKLQTELIKVIKVIKEQNKHSKLNKYLFEEKFNVYKDQDDYKITFKGLIDKVMYQEINNREVLMVIDYKTGKTVIDLDLIKDGLHMQLPIYLYLLKKSDKFKDAIIGGFYIQEVINDLPNISKKSLDEVRYTNLRLQGYTNNLESIIALIDDEYPDGHIIKGLKYSNGVLNNYKVLSEEEMDDLTSLVDNKIDAAIDDILNGKFMINPKIKPSKINSCEYCLFKDICYKTKEDEVILGGEEDEVNA